MSYRQRLTPEQAFQKARHYCAYQERSHQEVKQKLYSFGLRTNEVEELISRLIEENYLNEERFAVQFAGGRFRLKHWGRVKIRYELKLKQVGEYNIKKALSAIDETDYDLTLAKLAADKWETLAGEENAFSRRRRLHDFLLQRGFESDKIQEQVKQLSTNKP